MLGKQDTLSLDCGQEQTKTGLTMLFPEQQSRANLVLESQRRTCQKGPQTGRCLDGGDEGWGCCWTRDREEQVHEKRKLERHDLGNRKFTLSARKKIGGGLLM